MIWNWSSVGWTSTNASFTRGWIKAIARHKQDNKKLSILVGQCRSQWQNVDVVQIAARKLNKVFHQLVVTKQWNIPERVFLEMLLGWCDTCHSVNWVAGTITSVCSSCRRACTRQEDNNQHNYHFWRRFNGNSSPPIKDDMNVQQQPQPQPQLLYNHSHNRATNNSLYFNDPSYGVQWEFFHYSHANLVITSGRTSHWLTHESTPTMTNRQPFPSSLLSLPRCRMTDNPVTLPRCENG